MAEDTWECRSALRWGSLHEGYFADEASARAYAEKEITLVGGSGRITAVTERTVYFDRYRDEV